MSVITTALMKLQCPVILNGEQTVHSVEAELLLRKHARQNEYLKQRSFQHINQNLQYRNNINNDHFHFYFL